MFLIFYFCSFIYIPLTLKSLPRHKMKFCEWIWFQLFSCVCWCNIEVTFELLQTLTFWFTVETFYPTSAYPTPWDNWPRKPCIFSLWNHCLAQYVADLNLQLSQVVIHHSAGLDLQLRNMTSLVKACSVCTWSLCVFYMCGFLLILMLFYF